VGSRLSGSMGVTSSACSSLTRCGSHTYAARTRCTGSKQHMQAHIQVGSGTGVMHARAACMCCRGLCARGRGRSRFGCGLCYAVLGAAGREAWKCFGLRPLKWSMQAFGASKQASKQRRPSTWSKHAEET